MHEVRHVLSDIFNEMRDSTPSLVHHVEASTADSLAKSERQYQLNTL